MKYEGEVPESLGEGWEFTRAGLMPNLNLREVT